MVVGGESLERVLKPIEAKRLSQTVAIVTLDGTLGDRGRVMDALPEAADRSKAQVIYAAAPALTLERIAAFCRERGLPAQVALEERMGCGFGLCQTCVVPVARKDGSGYDTRPASCGIAGSATVPRCSPHRPRGCPWSARGRGERHGGPRR
jgi:dihydroorotate dehydrogenase electron transfer subunit